MNARISRSRSGGALVFVLLVLVFSGALVAGWLSLHGAQSVYIEMLDEASMRRIACENAAVVVRQYLLENVAAGGGDHEAVSWASPASATHPAGAWGTLAIGASSGAPLEWSGPSTLGWNRFNWGDGEGYSFEVVATVGAPLPLSEGWQTRFAASPPEPMEMILRFQIRSRSPMLGGDLFTGHVGSALEGAVAVNGRSVIWQDGGFGSLATTNYTARDGATVSSGPLSNFPFVPVTSGFAGATIADAYAGWLNVVDNGGINSLYEKAESVQLPSEEDPLGVAMHRIDGSPMEADGIRCYEDDETEMVVAEIDLREPSLGNIVIDGNVDTIVFLGQTSAEDFLAAGNLRSMLVVVNQPAGSLRDLVSIRFTARNNRKLAVALKKASGTATTFALSEAGLGPLRALFTIESAPSIFVVAAGATLQLVGGIQTNALLSVLGGSVDIFPESEPMLLERLTARNAWIESYEVDAE